MIKPVFDMPCFDVEKETYDPEYENTPVFPVGAIGRTQKGLRFLVLAKQEHCARPGELLAIIETGGLAEFKVGDVAHYSHLIDINCSTEPKTHEPIEWEDEA